MQNYCLSITCKDFIKKQAWNNAKHISTDENIIIGVMHVVGWFPLRGDRSLARSHATAKFRSAGKDGGRGIKRGGMEGTSDRENIGQEVLPTTREPEANIGSFFSSCCPLGSSLEEIIFGILIGYAPCVFLRGKTFPHDLQAWHAHTHKVVPPSITMLSKDDCIYLFCARHYALWLIRLIVHGFCHLDHISFYDMVNFWFMKYVGITPCVRMRYGRMCMHPPIF